MYFTHFNSKSNLTPCLISLTSRFILITFQVHINIHMEVCEYIYIFTTELYTVRACSVEQGNKVWQEGKRPHLWTVEDPCVFIKRNMKAPKKITPSLCRSRTCLEKTVLSSPRFDQKLSSEYSDTTKFRGSNH